MLFLFSYSLGQKIKFFENHKNHKNFFFLIKDRLFFPMKTCEPMVDFFKKWVQWAGDQYQSIRFGEMRGKNRIKKMQFFYIWISWVLSRINFCEGFGKMGKCNKKTKGKILNVFPIFPHKKWPPYQKIKKVPKESFQSSCSVNMSTLLFIYFIILFNYKTIWVLIIFDKVFILFLSCFLLLFQKF